MPITAHDFQLMIMDDDGCTDEQVYNTLKGVQMDAKEMRKVIEDLQTYRPMLLQKIESENRLFFHYRTTAPVN